MRLGRIILAGLAPLVSLSAFAAGLVAEPVSSTAAQHLAPVSALPGLLQAVVPLLIKATEAAAPATFDRSNHGILTLQALTATPFRGSLHLLNSELAENFLARRHQRALLRC